MRKALEIIKVNKHRILFILKSQKNEAITIEQQQQHVVVNVLCVNSLL